MKPIALMSIGLLGSAVTAAAVTGYLAWNNLSGADIGSNPAASVTATKPQNPPTQAPQPIAAPTQAAFTPPAPADAIFNQAENDFLFDLTQALQPVEQDRLSDAERLAMARQITAWLESGADYWSLRSQFDAAYQNEIVGDYAFNREVYLKFAVERFVPAAWVALAPPRRTPAPQPNPPEDFSAEPDWYEPPYAEPPYAEPPYEPPYPYPYPPVARPPQPHPHPDWHPDWNSDAYPVPPQPPIAQQPPISRPPIRQPPMPPQPRPEQPPGGNPDWYQNPDSPLPPNPNPAPALPNPDPNVTEISVEGNPTF